MGSRAHKVCEKKRLQAKTLEVRARADDRMKRAKKSSVWDHFTKKNDTDVSCNLCDTVLKYSSSTSSIRIRWA